MTQGIVKKVGLFVFGLLISTATFADYEDLPPEMWNQVFRCLPRQETVGSTSVCRAFNHLIKIERRIRLKEDRAELIQSWPGFVEFESQFVKIPQVTLPKLKGYPYDTSVPPFETSRYPVTRKIWVDLMGEESLHVDLKDTWRECPDCPITHVTWEEKDASPAEIQEFLRRLNELTAKLGCTYDLPTDPQLWAAIRGDVTGEDQSPYSKGVTHLNVKEYVTYSENSDTDGTGKKIQPVGLKKLNAFGIELGNVIKITKDLRTPDLPIRTQRIRGASWSSERSLVNSDYEFLGILVGNRNSFVGFALVRNCKSANVVNPHAS
jgi:hypothetical protein